MTRPEAAQSSDSTCKITKRKFSPAQLQRTLRHKRCKTLISKSDQLRKLGARVYTVIEVNGRYHVYSSESSDSWPLNEGSLSKNYPVPLRYWPHMKELSQDQATQEKEDEAEKEEKATSENKQTS
ncbi:hypothetical protein H9Q72_011374 [Fusarium xylarioides]|uniref:MADS-box domain-containing protein n=1 Tax=Fusarium xylarioides TaxID=221167 RepID=A0A9P7HR92_9HYPO|nr:hypothetical protein H9Q72_011374 [Fusarium xylarioides]